MTFQFYFIGIYRLKVLPQMNFTYRVCRKCTWQVKVWKKIHTHVNDMTQSSQFKAVKFTQ